MNLTNLQNWVLSPTQTPNTRLRLFCFPYAGAGASIFRQWSTLLPSTIAICPIQLPGRENRLSEPPFTEIPPLIETLTQVLRPYLSQPFAFFGHSVGALICFELARQLAQQKAATPIHLFASGHSAPQIAHSDPPLHQLPDAALIEKLRAYGGTPEAVLQNPELMELFLPQLRADFALNETYVYTEAAPLNCPISVFGGLADHTVDFEKLQAWQVQTHQICKVFPLPGNHFFIEQNRREILQMIAQILQPFWEKFPDS